MLLICVQCSFLPTISIQDIQRDYLKLKKAFFFIYFIIFLALFSTNHKFFITLAYVRAKTTATTLIGHKTR